MSLPAAAPAQDARRAAASAAATVSAGDDARLAARSETYELVAVASGAALTLYLDRFTTNEPVVDATIEVIAGSERVAAEARADGSYRASLPGLARSGQHELVFAIAHATGDDLLAAVLDRDQAGGGAATPRSERTRAADRTSSIAAILLALAAGLLAGLALRRTTHGRPT